MMLKWFKDGLPIEAASLFSISVPGVRTRLIDEFSLALVIENLSSASHNGNYSCVASNDAASVNHTAQLVVNGECKNSNQGTRPDCLDECDVRKSESKNKRKKGEGERERDFPPSANCSLVLFCP